MYPIYNSDQLLSIHTATPLFCCHGNWLC